MDLPRLKTTLTGATTVRTDPVQCFPTQAGRAIPPLDRARLPATPAEIVIRQLVSARCVPVRVLMRTRRLEWTHSVTAPAASIPPSAASHLQMLRGPAIPQSAIEQ